MHTPDEATLHERIFAIITATLMTTGRPPTQREIEQQLDSASIGHFTFHVEQVTAQGRPSQVSCDPAFPLPPPDFPSAPSCDIPVLGTIAAGVPLDSAETSAVLVDIKGGPYPPDTFALQVRDDSLSEDHILTGDYVLITPTRVPKQRAIIVVTHLTAGEHGAAKLKRFVRKRTEIVLSTINASCAPLHIPVAVWEREWRVEGIVQRIFRLG